MERERFVTTWVFQRLTQLGVSREILLQQNLSNTILFNSITSVIQYISAPGPNVKMTQCMTLPNSIPTPRSQQHCVRHVLLYIEVVHGNNAISMYEIRQCNVSIPLRLVMGGSFFRTFICGYPKSPEYAPGVGVGRPLFQNSCTLTWKGKRKKRKPHGCASLVKPF